jgi:hypothetical protein
MQLACSYIDQRQKCRRICAGVFFESPCDVFDLGIYSYDIFGLGIDIIFSCDIRNTVCFTLVSSLSLSTEKSSLVQ